jgi:putative transposase
MAGTYTKLYIHIVIAVNNQNYLPKEIREKVFAYLGGIINEKGHKTLIVNGIHDHVHLLVGLNPKESISDIVRDCKNNSTNFINKNMLVRGPFSWQAGYGAFSCGYSQLDTVYHYIQNQEEHHSKKTFCEEYEEFLKMYHVEYDKRYIFR